MDRIKVFISAMLLCSLTAGAQQDSVQVVKEKAKPIFGITLINQYIWRGLDEGNVCVQPTVGVSYKGLSFSAWGSVGFQRDDLKEFDLLLSYTTHGFNVGITDYWFGQGRYFLYTNNETTHVFEANVGQQQRSQSLLQLFRVLGTLPCADARLEGCRRFRALRHIVLQHKRICRDQREPDGYEGLPHLQEIPPARVRRFDGES